MPVDLSQLSDEQLLKLYNKSKANKKLDLNSLSDEQIKKLYGEVQNNKTPPKIVDERTPYVSVKERALLKNLTNNPTEAVEWLRQQHPELQIELGANDILVKKPNEKEFKKVDPSKWELEDITDIGDVAAKAVAATAGGIVGGTAGAAKGATLGGAAGSILPGAGTAVGASAGGLAGAYGGAVAGATAGESVIETIKQGLARSLGMSKKFHAEPYKEALKWNAILAPIVGTGVAKPAIASAIKAAAPNSVKTAAAAELLNRGLLGVGKQGVKGVSLSLTEKLTGAKKEATKTIFEPSGYKELLKKEEQGGVLPTISALRTKIKSGLSKAQKEADENIGQIYKSIPENGINLEQVKKPYMDLINELGQVANKAPTESNVSAYKDAVAEYERIFKGGPFEFNTASGDTAKALKSQLDTAAEYSKLKPTQGTVNLTTKGKDYVDKRLTVSAQQAGQALKEQLDAASGGSMSDFMTKSSEIRKIKEILNPTLKSNQAAYNSFKGLDTPGRMELADQLSKLDQQFNLNLKKEIGDIQTFNIFSKPSAMPQSFGGTTSTSRSMAGESVLGGLGRLGGKATGLPGGETAGYSMGRIAAALGLNPQSVRKAAAINYYGSQAAKLIPGFERLPYTTKYQLLKELELNQNMTPIQENPWEGL